MTLDTLAATSCAARRGRRLGSCASRVRHGFVSAAAFCFLVGSGSSASEDPALLDRSGGARWGAHYFPDVVLTTHEGKRVRFFSDLIEGKVVVINFFYTTCPDVCPLETAKLVELQAILGDRVGEDVFMYSISIDPDVDTPEVLAEYARRFGIGPGWLFLTAPDEAVTLLRRRLGLYDDSEDDDSKDHNLSIVIGNQSTGRWMRRSPFENSYFLADQVGGWLHNWKELDSNQDSYENAPHRLRLVSTGERLFESRCAACHIIGNADQVPAHQSGRLIGPDLLGVTERRERQWLARWLAEPDLMLAEGDPIALELFERHNRVPMPNMALYGEDVEALLEYLETESRRVAALPRRSPFSVGLADAIPAECCKKGGVDGLSVEASEALAGGGQPSTAAGRRPVERSARFFAYGFPALGGLFLFLAIHFRRSSRTPAENGLRPGFCPEAGRPVRPRPEKEIDR